jgi:hypothetical protein
MEEIQFYPPVLQHNGLSAFLDMKELKHSLFLANLQMENCIAD